MLLLLLRLIIFLSLNLVQVNAQTAGLVNQNTWVYSTEQYRRYEVPSTNGRCFKGISFAANRWIGQKSRGTKQSKVLYDFLGIKGHMQRVAEKNNSLAIRKDVHAKTLGGMSVRKIKDVGRKPTLDSRQ